MIAYALQQKNADEYPAAHLIMIIKDTIARDAVTSTHKCKPHNKLAMWSIYRNGGWTIQPLELERIT